MKPEGDVTSGDLSWRLAAILDALALRPGMRVLEIGCGPGALARAIAGRVGDGQVLAIDRSAKAIAQLRAQSLDQMTAGRLSARVCYAENLVLGPDESRFDLAVAIRVGALDGRHPAAGKLALRQIAAALTPVGRLFIDGGNPLREVRLPR